MRNLCVWVLLVHVLTVCLNYYKSRGLFGSCALLGDERWAGDYGVEADFWSDGETKMAFVPIADIQV